MQVELCYPPSSIRRTQKFGSWALNQTSLKLRMLLVDKEKSKGKERERKSPMKRAHILIASSVPLKNDYNMK